MAQETDAAHDHTEEHDCAFCNPEGLQDRIVRRSELTTTFLSNPRLTRGHTLIIPNRHVLSVPDLHGEEFMAIAQEVRAVTLSLRGAVAPNYHIWVKDQPEAPTGEIHQAHLHLHILPTNPGEPLNDGQINWEAESFSALEDEERVALLGILKTHQQESP